MNKKKLLSLILVVALMVSLVGLFTTTEVNAAYGTSLFNKDIGTISVESSMSNGGAKMTVAKTTDGTASMKYNVVADMQKFGITILGTTVNYSELFVKIIDEHNSTKFVEITIKESGDTVKVVVADNYRNKSKETDVSAKLTSKLNLTYSAGVFKLNDTVINLKLADSDTESIKTTTFYNDEAYISIGVNKQSKETDSVFYIVSMENILGVQEFDDKVEGFITIPTLLKRKLKVPTTDTISTKAAFDEEYVFPVYGIDIFNRGVSVKMKEPNDTEFGSPIIGKTKHKLDKEGTYTFELSDNGAKDNIKKVTIEVTTVEDNVAPKVDIDKFNAKMSGIFSDQVVSASEYNNTFTFPTIDDVGDNIIIFPTEDNGVDTLYNIKVQVGYKKDGATGDFSYATGLDVKLDSEGLWTFEYKITDATGKNFVQTSKEDAQKGTIKFNVLDNAAPVIDMPEVKEIYINKEYIIPAATINDNASGVNASKSTMTIYDENNVDITKTFKKEIYKVKPNVLTANNTTNKEYTYKVVYTATDNSGNESKEFTMLIKVVNPPADEPEPNPANDVLKTVLIVIACLCGTGIVVLLFIKPKKN